MNFNFPIHSKREFSCLTCSATSDFKEECTPIINGVGVESTSTRGAGKSGIYTCVYLKGYISAVKALHASVNLFHNQFIIKPLVNSNTNVIYLL